MFRRSDGETTSVKVIADIATGNTDAADVFFLIAFVLATIAAIAYAVTQPAANRFAPALGWMGAAVAFLGWLVL